MEHGPQKDLFQLRRSLSLLKFIIVCLFVCLFLCRVGRYLHVKPPSQLPWLPGSSAELFGAWQKAVSGGQCLKFYYSIPVEGADVGSLKVFITTQGKQWIIFQTTQGTATNWRLGLADIAVPVTNNYKVWNPIHKDMSFFLLYTNMNKMNSLHQVEEHPKISDFLIAVNASK